MEKTVFLSITDAEKKSEIARNIIGREREIFSYEMNIENFENILAQPDVSQEFRKLLTDRLKTENAEREKSLQVYRALKVLVPAAELPALIATEKAKLP
jgi:hypothetical protein